MRWPWGRGQTPETLPESMNPVPAVKPAAEAYSSLGRWDPVTVVAGGAVAFGAGSLLGMLRLSDFDWTAVGLAAIAVAASCFAASTRGRDSLHDRLYLAKPIPENTEVVEDDDDGGIGDALTSTGLVCALLLAGMGVVHALDGNEAHVFLFGCWAWVSATAESMLGRLSVEQAERERGVRMYRIEDKGRYEDVTGEDLGDGDPGPMFHG